MIEELLTEAGLRLNQGLNALVVRSGPWRLHWSCVFATRYGARAGLRPPANRDRCPPTWPPWRSVPGESTGREASGPPLSMRVWTKSNWGCYRALVKQGRNGSYGPKRLCFCSWRRVRRAFRFSARPRVQAPGWQYLTY